MYLLVVRRWNGFTMVEMLIALVILSIGFLGVAGLQAVSLRSGHDAVSRSVASFHAYSLIESMHSHSRGSISSFVGKTATTAPSCDKTATTAVNERNCFFNKIMADLPDGQAAIVQNSDGTYTVSISWLDREDGSNAAKVQQSWVVVP